MNVSKPFMRLAIRPGRILGGGTAARQRRYLSARFPFARGCAEKVVRSTRDRWSRCRSRYLIDRFSVLTISPHLVTSDLNIASAWAGDPLIGSKPIVASFFWTSGFLMVSLIAAFSVVTICGSVLAGAKNPTHEAAKNPGKPAS